MEVTPDASATLATVPLGVAKERWGRGRLRRSCKFALQWSRERKLRRVELTVHASNDCAIDVYKRCGFQIGGVRRSSLRVDGRYVDEYLIRVVLAGQFFQQMDERFVVLACGRTEANIASAIASEIGIELFRADFLCLRRGRRSRQLRM